MKNYNVSYIKNLLSTAKTALIVVPQISVDSVGSALALAIALKKSNINAKVFSPQKTDNNYSKLSGLDLMTNAVSSGDLVVSLDYPLDQIEQVSYNDDGGRLNLVVKTKAASPKVENDKIIINNQSSAADICFMLGDETLLGPNSNITEKGNWIFISPTNIAKSWAKASLIDPDAPFSEIFTFLLPMLGLNLDADSGKNLLIGLRVATQSFSVNVSPETFEAGALCLRATQPTEANPNPFMNPTPIEMVETKPNQFQANKPSPVPTI
jgi:nanoRNase/pAp phosphatase (c-di-AMP/oligoRNAs hydrolase)